MTSSESETTLGSSPVRPVKDGLETADMDRLEQALDACDFILAHLTSQGRYEIDDSWGPEGELYLYGVASVLVEAYRISAEKEYLVGARKVFELSARLENMGRDNKIDGADEVLEEIERLFPIVCDLLEKEIQRPAA